MSYPYIMMVQEVGDFEGVFLPSRKRRIIRRRYHGIEFACGYRADRGWTVPVREVRMNHDIL